MLLDHLQTLTQSTKLMQKVHLSNPRKGKNNKYKCTIMMRLQIPFPRFPTNIRIRNKKVKGDDTTNISGITDKGVGTRFTYYYHGTIKEYHDRRNMPNGRNRLLDS